MRTLILMAIFGILDALHCDKEFTYYDDYGNGFSITCQGITKGYEHLIEKITITNEISLRIQNSTLRNVSSKIFDSVTNIRYLYLDNSTFDFPKIESVFQALTKLEHLLIRDTNFRITKNTFIGLDSLKELVLKNNSLEDIEEGSFQNLKDLNHLHLTNNQITHLKNLPLCELKKLRFVNLSRNAISNLSDVNFYCRRSAKSVDINLNNKDFLLKLPRSNFFSVSDVIFKLHNLDLSYNKISKLEFSLADLKNLKMLNLEGNLLVEIKYKELSSLKSIEKVYLQNNLLLTVDENVFSNKKNLQYLDLSNNNLTKLNVYNVPMLEYVNLANNKLDKSFLRNVTNASTLKTLNLCNNRIDNVLPYAFKKLSTLKVLNLDCNNLKLSSHSFSGLVMLSDLSLVNNSIVIIPEYLFSGLTNLRRLDLSKNRIKKLSSDAFKDLRNLETLNISYNLMQELDYALLSPLKNLNILDIAGNRLHHIQYDLIISGLPMLSVLNIKSNFLSCELLYKIITYLKPKKIGYTINEKFEYEKENVAGIYCNSEKNIVANSLKNESRSSESNSLFILGAVLVIVLVVIVIGVAVFKILVYLKRRKYRADEFELIDE